MSSIAEILQRVRTMEADHDPDGWPAIRMRDVREMADVIIAQQRTLKAVAKVCRELRKSRKPVNEHDQVRAHAATKRACADAVVAALTVKQPAKTAGTRSVK